MESQIVKELAKYSTRGLKNEVRRRNIFNNENLISITFDVCCKFYGVDKEDIFKKGTGVEGVRKCKSALCYIFHKKQHRTTVEVGTIMRKNHSTITISANKVASRIELAEKSKIHKDYSEEINKLNNQIKIREEITSV